MGPRQCAGENSVFPDFGGLGVCGPIYEGYPVVSGQGLIDIARYPSIATNILFSKNKIGYERYRQAWRHCSARLSGAGYRPVRQ